MKLFKIFLYIILVFISILSIPSLEEEKESQHPFLHIFSEMILSTNVADASATIFAINCGDSNSETLSDGSFYSKDRAYGEDNTFGYIGGSKSCSPFLFEREFVLKDRNKNEMDLHECTRDGVNSYIFDLDPGFYELTIHLISHDRHGKQDEMLTIMVEDIPIFSKIDYLGRGWAWQEHLTSVPW